MSTAAVTTAPLAATPSGTTARPVAAAPDGAGTAASARAAKTPGPDGRIAYTPAEDAVWATLFRRQLPNVGTHMARPWLDGLERLRLPPDRVPQCAEVSTRLAGSGGWRMEPVPALIGFERFFGMLAERRFPAASFIRRPDEIDYVEEPDIFHEVFGHGPLLCDPRLAAFSEAIGRAGVAADRRDRPWLIRLYWFTIEFGLTLEEGRVRALGSGLASSPTELPWSLGPDVERLPFDVVDILRTPYRIDIHQPLYFVTESVATLLEAAERDLLADVREARRRGLFAPRHPPKVASSAG